MGIGVSIFLIAVGAILAFAVTADANGIDVQAAGWIVLAVGVLGLVLSLIFWSSWGGPGYFTTRRRTYVEEGPAGPPQS
jgi:ABC-type transport system involved in cytochrome c biogenesis permease subunit